MEASTTIVCEQVALATSTTEAIEHISDMVEVLSAPAYYLTFLATVCALVWVMRKFF
jgi:hypothetical protein